MFHANVQKLKNKKINFFKLIIAKEKFILNFSFFILYYNVKKINNMAENKIIDIIKTMLERKMLDPIKALTDSDYLNERVSMYIEAANIAREMMHMEPLI